MNELAQMSVFDNIEVFDQTMRMATALSRSAFVPKAFQGSPESCLVAIDLARRLAVSPMTIFPHLYVIDCKPAFSTQFLITLVNRSGYFERLDWETGVDGETEVNYCDYRNGQRDSWKASVPNHYAIAKLTERRTGRTFTSPKVDIAFAELNGWTSKPGSKWRTMPEIMCAYRSASILIKRICPELTLGMNFAEDVEDGQEDTIELRRDAYIEGSSRGSAPTLTHIPAPTIQEFVAKIDSCVSEDELKIVGTSIRNAGFSESDRNLLSVEYKRRRDELRGIVVDVETDEAAPSLSAEDAIANAIVEAVSLDGLEAVKKALNEGVENNSLELDADAFAKLNAMIDEKLKNLETPVPTTKKDALKQLYDALAQTKDKEGILAVVSTANDYLAKKLITNKQHDAFLHDCDAHAEKVLI